MQPILLRDHEGRRLPFDGEELVTTSCQGFPHQTGVYDLTGTLYAAGEPPSSLVASVDLPCSHRDRDLTWRRHVVQADGLCRLLEQLDAIAVMQHVNIPHWIGSCAMLETDIEVRPRLHIALRRGLVDFMEDCRMMVRRRRDLTSLWL